MSASRSVFPSHSTFAFHFSVSESHLPHLIDDPPSIYIYLTDSGAHHPTNTSLTLLSSTSLLHGNCVFNRNNTVATQQGMKTYWLCKSYRVSMCRARCITHQGKIISTTGTHNHPPHVKDNGAGAVGSQQPENEGIESASSQTAPSSSSISSASASSSSKHGGKGQFVTISSSDDGGGASHRPQQLHPNTHSSAIPALNINESAVSHPVGSDLIINGHPNLNQAHPNPHPTGSQIVPVHSMIQTVFNPNLMGQVITGVSSSGNSQMILTPIHHSAPPIQQLHYPQTPSIQIISTSGPQQQQPHHHHHHHPVLPNGQLSSQSSHNIGIQPGQFMNSNPDSSHPVVETRSAEENHSILGEDPQSH